MKPTYEELEQERNELAAQVERLRGLLKPKVIDLIRCGIGSNYSGSLFDNAMKEYHEPLVLALSETPPAALAALKAQWQAEYEHCDHNYARFGDQPHRRCIKCDKVERAQEAGDA